MAEKEEKKAMKTKRPSTMKRKLQSDRQKIRNRSFKSRVSTAMRSLTESLTKKEPAQDKLSALYSLMDKGVKTGIFKANKAARTKSRFSARISAS